MKLFSRTRKFIKPFVDFPRWLNISELKRNNKTLYGFAKDIAKPELPPVHQETFEQAMVRLQLTEKDVLVRRAFFLRMTMVYVLIIAALVAYVIYLWTVDASILSISMLFSLLLVAAALAFKQHFWFIQMKSRRLGLSFGDWVQYTFKGR